MQLGSKFVSLEMATAALKRQSPELLAEVARQLSAVLVPEAEFNPETVCFAKQTSDLADRVTYSQLSQYLQKATGIYVPVLFETPERVVESHQILVNVDWFSRRVEAARENLGPLTIIEQSASNQVVDTSLAHRVNTRGQSFVNQPPPMTKGGLEQLHMLLSHQNDQRKATEAASRDALARREAERRAERAETELAISKAAITALENQLASASQRLNESIRTEALLRRDSEQLEEQLEQAMQVLNAIDPTTPYHPKELAMMFRCWNDVTAHGSFDPCSAAGVGVEVVVERWFKNEPQKPSKAMIERFARAIGWRGPGAVKKQ